MTARRLAAAAGALLLGLPLAGCGDRAEAAAQTVVVTMRWSRFAPAALTVPAGTTVRFVVRNTDPIDHELILGDEAVHRRHASGKEAWHGTVPGEVSVPAGAEGVTTFTFTRPGTLEFACHLPGHYAYGMRGLVRVTGGAGGTLGG